MIVEGQLKSQLKSGFVRNAGPDEANGGKGKGRKGGKDSKSEPKERHIVCLFSCYFNARAHVLCCSLLQETAAERGPISV